MEYYYEKNLKKWCSGEYYSRQKDPLSNEKINELRNARKNKKYIIVDNRYYGNNRPPYPGLNSEVIYFDIEDVKLKLVDGTIILYYDTKFSKSMSSFKITDIKNPTVIKNFSDNLNYVVKFVEDVSYIGPGQNELKDAIIHNNYWNLCSESQLYYQMEGNRLDLI